MAKPIDPALVKQIFDQLVMVLQKMRSMPSTVTAQDFANLQMLIAQL